MSVPKSTSLGPTPSPTNSSGGPRFFKPSARVTITRTSISTNPTKFSSSKLNVGDSLIISELRVKFKITRGLTKAPNQCDVYLYNLNQDSRTELESLPLSVTVEAGYDGYLSVVFTGDVHYAQSEEKGTEWETLLQLGDGDRPYFNARVNQSFKKGSTVRQVLSHAATAMGYALPSSLLSDASLDKPFVTGTAVRGPARDVFSQCLAPFGYRWSIQDGKLTVLKDIGTYNVATIPPGASLPIDQAHGMIGTPSFGSPPASGKTPHLHVKTLFDGNYTAGQLVKLTSKTKNGLFRIEKIDSEFDNAGSNEACVSKLELKPY